MTTGLTPPDRELAIAFAAGDPAAFGLLYERFVGRVYDFVRRTVRDRAAAEDITQDVFVRAYEARATLRDPDALRAWLFRIAHNAAVNQVTRAHAAEELDENAASPSSAPGPEDLVEQAESTELVWDAAASLEPRQYALLDLTVRKGLTNAEVAQVLDIEPAQASLAVFRAREALGNAVRFLLVARRRRHCDRLAELVPEGVRQLTPAQRATVDRHLRRCATCSGMALVLTEPERILAATPLLALPRTLHSPPHLQLTSAVTSGHRPRLARALVAGAAIAAAGLAALVVVNRPNHQPAASPPAGAATVVRTYEPWARNPLSGEAAPRPGLRVTAATGTCDSGAAADPGRAAAFRCIADGRRQDACFEPAPLVLPAPAVLCSGDPTDRDVLLVSLTAAVPTARRNAEDARAVPWFLSLADGRGCARLGGGTDTATLPYQCTDGSRVTAPDRSHQPWSVRNGPGTVAVRTAYR